MVFNHLLTFAELFGLTEGRLTEGLSPCEVSLFMCMGKDIESLSFVGQRDQRLLTMLSYSLGQDAVAPRLTVEQWQQLFEDASRHTLVGVLFEGIKLLEKEGRALCPPLPLLLHWAGDADNIGQLNGVFDAEAARLTRLFEAEGHDTVILKGQANARLYPNPRSRQSGDIDIWVYGGKERVMTMLRRLGLMDDTTDVCYHHVSLERNSQGIEVEVHFLPSSGHNHAACNEHIQQFLDEELAKGCQMVSEGFRVPSLRFALVMQLAHIRHHLIKEGVGLRQLTDYWLLLRHSSKDDREVIASRLKDFGLTTIARALMWVIGSVFGERECLLPVKPSERKGRWLLKKILQTGNFGKQDRKKQQVLWREVLRQKKELLPLLWFEPEFATTLAAEECRYWWCIVRTLPERIRYRSLSLRDHRGDKVNSYS